MDSKNCRWKAWPLLRIRYRPLVDCRLNGFARAARFGMRRSATGRIRRGELDAAFVRLSDAGFALLFAGDRLQF